MLPRAVVAYPLFKGWVGKAVADVWVEGQVHGGKATASSTPKSICSMVSGCDVFWLSTSSCLYGLCCAQRPAVSTPSTVPIHRVWVCGIVVS